jgi:hypothetical protein
VSVLKGNVVATVGIGDDNIIAPIPIENEMLWILPKEINMAYCRVIELLRRKKIKKKKCDFKKMMLY